MSPKNRHRSPAADRGRGRAPDRDRLALIGDVHGNARALEAVLADIAAAGITRGVVTGDLVMRGTDPEAAIRAVRGLGWPSVIGNTDEKVGAGRPRPAGHPASDRAGSRSWTIRRLSDDDRAWLAGLPRRVHVELGGRSVLVTHGQPGDLSVALDVGTPDADLARVARQVDADVLVFGHTHRPMARRAGGVLFVNPGAVGEGLPDDQRPAWAWLEVVAGVVHAHLERVDAPLAPPRGA